MRFDTSPTKKAANALIAPFGSKVYAHATGEGLRRRNAQRTRILYTGAVEDFRAIGRSSQCYAYSRSEKRRRESTRNSFLGWSYDKYVAEPPQPTQVAEKIAGRIAVYVGPHTARVAVKTFALRKLGRRPENLELEDVPALLAALRPMLRTLIGHSQCELALKRIERELGL
jgi:hypothetical protein